MVWKTRKPIHGAHLGIHASDASTPSLYYPPTTASAFWLSIGRILFGGKARVENRQTPWMASASPQGRVHGGFYTLAFSPDDTSANAAHKSSKRLA